MRRLVLTVVLSFVSLHRSALVGDSLNPKAIILSELLANECPGVIPLIPSGEDKVSYVHLLERELLKCRQDKLVSTNSKTTAAVTKAPPSCPSYAGDSVFTIQFISYSNPTEKKAKNFLCRTDGSRCGYSVEICVGSIKHRKCKFHHTVADIVGKKSRNGISENFGNLTNPMKINLGHKKWKGASVRITVLKRNSGNSPRAYYEIEKFRYGLTDMQGSSPRIITLHGKDAMGKRELVLMFTVPCPSPSTTLPTTPTILPTTTTSSPAECLTATNLTQSWRLDHNGSDIHGGGVCSSNGYACDMQNRNWFRFTGDAGTHMLDTCPKWKSCGTLNPLWTDVMPPQAIGVPFTIRAYGMVRDTCKKQIRIIQVMRCSLSTDHDLIYRYVGHDPASPRNTAFCGMN